MCVSTPEPTGILHLAAFSRPLFFLFRKLCACDVVINTVVSCKQQHITLTKATHVVHGPINIKVGQGLFLGDCCTTDCFRVWFMSDNVRHNWRMCFMLNIWSVSIRVMMWCKDLRKSKCVPVLPSGGRVMCGSTRCKCVHVYFHGSS